MATADTLSLDFEGRVLVARAGQSVAAALLGAGECALRQTMSGDPRGVYCGMGVCFDCLVTIDGAPHRRACMTAARDGMSVRRDVPLAAAHATDEGATEVRERACDVLVVGGGPAGLAAAATAAGAGLDVVLVDERPKPGGQYYKQPATAAVRPDRQAEAGAARVAAAARAGVDILTDVAIWAASWPGSIAGIGRGTRWTFKPAHLLLATGAGEASVPFPGWTLPGVMTTGAAQGLVRSHGAVPGRRILVAGNGPLNLQTAVELRRAGVEVVAVCELAAAPSLRRFADLAVLAATAPDLMRDGLALRMRLAVAGVPMLYGTAIVAADGDGRVSRATVARIDAAGQPIGGSARSFDVDCLAVGYGFVPSNEISRALGCRHRFDDRFGELQVEKDSTGRTSVANVWVAGDCGGLGGARLAEAEGTLAAAAIARAMGRVAPSTMDAIERDSLRARDRALRFQQALWRVFDAPRLTDQLATPDCILCRCESVTVGAVRAALARDVRGIGAVKRLTRAGMGRCQGRGCARLLTAMAARAAGRSTGERDFFAPRLPVKPVTIGDAAAPGLPPLLGEARR